MIEKIKNIQHNISDWLIKKSKWAHLDKRAEKFIQDFEEVLTPRSQILDIGAGPGVYYEPLTKRGHEAVLLDVQKYKTCPYPVTYFNGSQIPFADKSFDTSLLITVLHHTPNPEAILKEAKRVTRKNIIVIEDIYTRPGGKAKCVIRDAVLNFEFVGHPMNFKSYEGWKNTFRNQGLSVVKEKDFYSYVGWLPIRTGLYILKP